MPPRLAASFHAFTAILLAGTLWRILAYHALASSSASLQHVGAAMVTQY